MSVKVYPFDLGDLFELQLQDQHAYLMPQIWRNFAEVSRRLVGPFSYTAWAPSGIPLACCGIMTDGTAWALLSKDIKRYMLPVTREVRKVLDNHSENYGPVWADLDETFAPAVRWAKILGFKPMPGKWLHDPNANAV